MSWCTSGDGLQVLPFIDNIIPAIFLFISVVRVQFNAIFLFWNLWIYDK